jgi:hypothetical protein
MIHFLKSIEEKIYFVIASAASFGISSSLNVGIPGFGFLIGLSLN